METLEKRDYQVQAIAPITKALKESGRALVVMATGLGKTIVSAMIVEELLGSGKRGLFLCHENDILEQAEGKYREIIGDHIHYSTFYGGSKDWYADQAQMLFASFQSMNNHHAEWYQVFDHNHFDFLVVDESHHGQAATYSKVINHFNCMKLGMTATPDREDGRDIREIFGEEVVDIPLEVGMARGWLAHIEYHVLSDGINTRKLKKILGRVLKHRERVSVKQLNETIFVDARSKQQQLTIEEYTKVRAYTRGGKKTMIFCENITHAEHVFKYFEGASMVHSCRSTRENHEALQAFRRGDTQYLISVDKMNEGIDVPDVEVVVFLRATDSKRVWYQQTGRGARKTAQKKRLVVLDFVANVDRLLALRELMDRVVDEAEKDEELRGKLSKRIFDVSGEGFDFVFSDDIVDLIKVIEVLKGGFYETWQEASAAAIRLGIKTSVEYKKVYKLDPMLPSRPEQFYHDFPGYGVFLGREEALKGWMTATQLSLLREVRRGFRTIKEFAEEYRQDHPEWFAMYFAGNTFAEHYHPDLVKILKRLCARKGEFPKGWMTASKLSLLDQVVGGNPKIKALAERYRQDHPEWFRVYSTGGKVAEHYHPDLVKILKRLCSRKGEKSPKGWMTANQLIRLLGVRRGFRTIKALAEKYRQDHPEWFGLYFTKAGIAEHYHPDLVKILKRLCSRKGEVKPKKIKAKK